MKNEKVDVNEKENENEDDDSFHNDKKSSYYIFLVASVVKKIISIWINSHKNFSFILIIKFL